MKYVPINGWTKPKIIEAIQTKNKGTPSMISDGVNCAYFGKDGNRCAVGCFIPDDFVGRAGSVEEWESYCFRNSEDYGVKALIRDFPELELPLEADALENLQSIHDRAGPTQDPRPAMVKWVEENVA